ncbi:uncharacterized protein LOC111600596 [Drosophila hydei]|uniref:Uncharacterized protein LOC111600596 n=1 Tax=Drosophila hydei TaxID=7224 RepID=A0A6J2SY23_DROHY|nr:uncharacterized protein LOC111600596 [Drosophila hydei]
MNSKLIIFIAFICIGLLLETGAVTEKRSCFNCIETFKNASNATSKHIDNTKIKVNETKNFMRKLKFTNPEDFVLSGVQMFTNNSEWKLSMKPRVSRIKHPLSSFINRFKHKLDFLHKKKPLKLDKPQEKQYYMIFKEKLHMVLYDKHFSPKLSVVKLMYTIVEGFWNPNLIR